MAAAEGGPEIRVVELHRLEGQAGGFGDRMHWMAATRITLPASANVAAALQATAGLTCVQSDGRFWESPQPADVCVVNVIVRGRVAGEVHVWSRPTAGAAAVTAAAAAEARALGIVLRRPVMTGLRGTPLRRGRCGQRWRNRPQHAELRELGPATGSLRAPLPPVAEEPLT